MTSMRLFVLATCLTAVGAFGWGMARFFRKPTRNNTRTSLVGGLALISAAWHVYAVASAGTGPLRCIAAIGLNVFAIGLFFAAVGSCRRRSLTAIFETDLPCQLLCEGPFGYVRHPFYTAYILFWVSGWIASGSAIAFLSAVAMSVTYVWAATKEEEKFRVSRLAAEHAEYCRRTGFMLPRVSWRGTPDRAC